MSTKKKNQESAEEKTPLQEYLEKPLPPFSRGNGDCAAFVVGWINHLLGSEAVKLSPITFGEAKRRALQIEFHGAEFLKSLEWQETKRPSDGDIVFYICPQALAGKAIGISSEGKAISRMEGEGLHITLNPQILSAWSKPS